MLDKYISYYTERQLKRRQKKKEKEMQDHYYLQLNINNLLKKNQTLGSKTCIFS